MNAELRICSLVVSDAAGTNLWDNVKNDDIYSSL